LEKSKTPIHITSRLPEPVLSSLGKVSVDTGLVELQSQETISVAEAIQVPQPYRWAWRQACDHQHQY